MPGSEIRAGGRKAYSYGLYVAFALLTVVLVPATVAVLNRLYGTDAQVSFDVLARQVLVVVLLPLAVGLLIHGRWPALASRLSPIVSRVSMALLVVVLIPLVVTAWPAIISLIGNGTVLAVVAISVAAIAAGHILAAPDPHDQVALATAAAVRHPGIALMVAKGLSPDKKVTAMILLYVLVSFIVITVYQQALKRLGKARGGGQAVIGGGLR